MSGLGRDLPRTPGRRTSVSSALELGTLLLESSEKDITATRRVIDVSGALITVATLIALYRTNELPIHVKKALENGISRDESR